MTVHWHSRQDVGLAPPDLNHMGLRIGKIRGVVIHWIDGGPEPQHPSFVWRGLQKAAMSGQNVNHTVYGDIEYNAGICESIAHPGNGSILAGRDNRFNGAHALSTGGVANHTLLGAAVLGNQLTAGVKQALDAYIFTAWLGFDHSQPFVLEGHQELVNVGGIHTACPGAFMDYIRMTRAAHGWTTL